MIYKLYHGSSPYLSLGSAHAFINTEKTKNPNLEIIPIQGDTEDPQKVLDLVSSQSLFFQSKLIFIKRIYKNKKKSIFLDDLLTILKTNTSPDILVFWEDQKIKSNTKYYKFFKQSNAVEGMDSLNKRTFFQWTKKILKEQNIKIQSDAIKELAEKTNYDPERFQNEIEKLALTDDEGVITKEQVNTLTSDTLEQDIWNLIDSINDQNKINSMKILEKLKLQNVDPNYTISMLARNLRLITLTKFLSSRNKSYSEIASELAVPPFTVPRLVTASKKYSDEKITKLYTKMSNLDMQIKMGQIDGNLGLTILLPYIY